MTLTSLPRYHWNQLDTVFADYNGGIPQDDGPDLVCRIDYPPAFRQAYDLFRGLLQRPEDVATERALALTCLCLEQNPANYTVWHVRRQCLLGTTTNETNDDAATTTPTTTTTADNHQRWADTTSLPEWLPLELQFTADLGGTNPKNYQIWYHRRSLLQALFDRHGPDDGEETLESSRAWQHAVQELDYLDQVFAVDAKNYHAWSHRQFLVLLLAQYQQQQQQQQQERQTSLESSSDSSSESSSDIWASELLATQQLIQTDVRNNSAWNHRWFALHQGTTHGHKNTTTTTTHKMATLLPTELDYVLQQIALDVYNESSCRYFVALLKEQQQPQPRQDNPPTDWIATYLPQLEAVRQEHNAATAATAGIAPSTNDTDDDDDAAAVVSALLDLYQAVGNVAAARTLVERLQRIDPIRRKYWDYRNTQLLQRQEQQQQQQQEAAA